mmetsp:Transcript_55609/g.64986  ORF Transcript_55609/g.64986 Transcript_55609/m.64986 type:complete len:145 (+) Transcript_55609:66-500(+)
MNYIIYLLFLLLISSVTSDLKHANTLRQRKEVDEKTLRRDLQLFKSKKGSWEFPLLRQILSIQPTNPPTPTPNPSKQKKTKAPKPPKLSKAPTSKAPTKGKNKRPPRKKEPKDSKGSENAPSIQEIKPTSEPTTYNVIQKNNTI